MERMNLVVALFLGMALMIPLIGGLSALNVSHLREQHEVDKEAAVYFATLGHAEDIEYCTQTVVICTRVVDHCLSALGRDSGLNVQIPFELEML